MAAPARANKEEIGEPVVADRWLVYGSPSSIDCDVFVPLDADLVRRISDQCKNTHRLVYACAELQRQLVASGHLASALAAGRTISVNVGVVDWERGVLLWSLKGDADETNNVLLAQYAHHASLQRHALYIRELLPVGMQRRTLHTLRAVLGILARTTTHRDVCKPALKVRGDTPLVARFPLPPHNHLHGWSPTITLSCWGV
jgi:hypothetical protein